MVGELHDIWLNHVSLEMFEDTTDENCMNTVFEFDFDFVSE